MRTHGDSLGTHGILHGQSGTALRLPSVSCSRGCRRCLRPRLPSRVLSSSVCLRSAAVVLLRFGRLNVNGGPYRKHRACCSHLHNGLWPLCSSADTHSDERRRHQPAHTRADGAADVPDVSASLLADISRRCAPCTALPRCAPLPPSARSWARCVLLVLRRKALRRSDLLRYGACVSGVTEHADVRRY